MKFRVYRYDPELGQKPRMQEFEVETHRGMMLRDALKAIKAQDETFAFRHSCGEGVCGSDGVNVNGTNKLACVTAIADLKEPIEVRPFPGRPVVRDLVVDMTQFYEQYKAVEPWLKRKEPTPEQEILQSPADRDKLLGPQALLTAYRFLADSRDQASAERMDFLEGPYKLFRCHSIMNCVEVCPKGLNPTKAIGHIKEMMLKDSV